MDQVKLCTFDERQPNVIPTLEMPLVSDTLGVEDEHDGFKWSRFLTDLSFQKFLEAVIPLFVVLELFKEYHYGHNDIKPSNIACTFSNEALVLKLIDFGVAGEEAFADRDRNNGEIEPYRAPELHFRSQTDLGDEIPEIEKFLNYQLAAIDLGDTVQLCLQTELPGGRVDDVETYIEHTDIPTIMSKADVFSLGFTIMLVLKDKKRFGQAKTRNATANS